MSQRGSIVANTSNQVLLIDPWPSTPDYNCALTEGLRAIGIDARLWTADYHHRPWEPAALVDGRSYQFLRISRQLRRLFKGNRWLTYISYATMLPEYWINWAQLIFYICTRRPLVHVQWVLHPLVDILPLLLLRLLAIKLVWTAHNVLPHDQDTRANRILFGLIYRLADRVIVHSENNLKEMEGIFSLGSKLCHVPFGLPFIDVSPVSRANVRDKFGWDNGEEVIVFQGRVQPYKGLDTLLESLTSIGTSANIRLVLSVDWDAPGDGCDQLLERVRNIHKVQVFSETTSVWKFRDLACGADLWVLPYRSGSASFPGMVALRYCTPMIVTNVGGLPEMLGENLTDWVVPPDDVAALTKAIHKYLALSADERHQIRLTLDAERRRFAWPEIAAQTAEIYKALWRPSSMKK